MRGIGRRSALLVGLLGITLMGRAQQQADNKFGLSSVDLSGTYSAEHSNVAGSSTSVWLQGGSGEVAATLYRGLGAAVIFTGEHASNIQPGVNLSEFSVMAGPRYAFRNLGEKHATRFFGEALFGTVYAFNGLFPTSSGVVSSTNAFSMQVGGGIDVGLGKGFSVRALELDYVRTSLPNDFDNVQNHFRLAFGISYHIERKH